MNFIFNIIQKLFLVHIMWMHDIYGCLSVLKSKKCVQITGNELDKYLDLNVFEPYFFDQSDAPKHKKRAEKRAYKHFDKINLILYIPKHKKIYDIDIAENILNLFNFAIFHLRENFMDDAYESEMVRKILMCCIEYSLRLGSEKYIDLRTEINCKRILGIDGDKLGIYYQAVDSKENQIFSITID